MKQQRMWMIGFAVVWMVAVGGYAISAENNYEAKVPGGLAMSEFA